MSLNTSKLNSFTSKKTNDIENTNTIISIDKVNAPNIIFGSFFNMAANLEARIAWFSHKDKELFRYL